MNPLRLANGLEAVESPALSILCTPSHIKASIELVEEFTGNSTPDRGLQLAQALFSIAWLALGLGLWLGQASQPDDPRLAA
jgi:hypothetical protein